MVGDATGNGLRSFAVSCSRDRSSFRISSTCSAIAIESSVAQAQATRRRRPQQHGRLTAGVALQHGEDASGIVLKDGRKCGETDDAQLGEERSRHCVHDRALIVQTSRVGLSFSCEIRVVLRLRPAASTPVCAQSRPRDDPGAP
eukprot:778585-Prymnesium_polylepis.1